MNSQKYPCKWLVCDQPVVCAQCGSDDVYAGASGDAPDKADFVFALEPVRSTRQNLITRQLDGSTLIEGLLVTDYAVLVEGWK